MKKFIVMLMGLFMCLISASIACAKQPPTGQMILLTKANGSTDTISNVVNVKVINAPQNIEDNEKNSSTNSTSTSSVVIVILCCIVCGSMLVLAVWDLSNAHEKKAKK